MAASDRWVVVPNALFSADKFFLNYLCTMEANLPLMAASQVSFPWLSLIVLLPVVGAMLMPLMPGGEKSF